MSMIPGWSSGMRTNVFDPFSLHAWDPFRGFPFNSTASSDNFAFVSTWIHLKETPEAHFFKVDLTGMRKEEVKVEVEDDRVLQISGERKVQKEDKNDTWHRAERSNGKFLRRFRLPENVKVDQVTAKMEEGVLTVIVPKVEGKEPDVRFIQITS